MACCNDSLRFVRAVDRRGSFATPPGGRTAVRALEAAGAGAPGTRIPTLPYEPRDREILGLVLILGLAWASSRGRKS